MEKSSKAWSSKREARLFYFMGGGNIWQGALIGGITGGIAGGVGIAVQGWESWVPRGIVQVGTGALVGGTVSQLMGGKFYEGAMTGAVSATVGFSASELVGQYFAELDKQLFKLTGMSVLYDKLKGAQGLFNDRKLFSFSANRVEITEQEFNTARAYYYDDMSSRLNPDIKLQASLIVTHGFKIGPYHFQQNVGDYPYSVHFEYDIAQKPLWHLLLDFWRTK